MEYVNVRGEAREPGNRHAGERLRRRGLVPAVIYGHKQEPETVALSLHDLRNALGHMQRVIRLVIDGREQQYLLKDVQYDHLQSVPVHVDLMRVDVNERVQVKVPMELRGEPKGVHEGGVLVNVLAELTVECLLLKIPDRITVNVAHLVLGESLHARDIELPPEVALVTHPDDVVAVVRAKRGVTAEEEAAAAAPAEGAPAEPEMIGRTAKTVEGEGEGA